ncbi:hypothetical protein CTZ27_33240 [Streptomyces griseocarneus]|nr:hypothetical protein CTZ27_33240 [Streptomyces griseocarneus]
MRAGRYGRQGRRTVVHGQDRYAPDSRGRPVKANTRRDNRLAFDTVAEAYDRARPTMPHGLIVSIVRITGMWNGDRVLEIGAATGQLTRPLRAAHLNVTALEPGERLRALLERNVAGDPGVTVRPGLFEDYDSSDDGPFSAVFSANAFHWIDPDVSYAKAAGMLRPDGHLVLLWNFPVVEDPALRDALNTRAFADYPDFVRDERHQPRIEALAAEGREELAASGRFDFPWWQTRTETLRFTADTYLQLLISYANGAVLDDDARQDLEQRVRAVLDDRGAETITVTNHLYALVARRADQ